MKFLFPCFLNPSPGARMRKRILMLLYLYFLDLTSRCPNLDHLDVTGCVLVSGVGVAAAPGSPTPRLPLHYLDMSDCPRLDDTALRLVVDSCPQIQFLFLRRCTQITGRCNVVLIQPVIIITLILLQV